MKPVKSGGGWQPIWYTLRKGREVGYWRLWKAMRSKNACKTCAVGMGGQSGGMVNEAGHFPEVCKKSLQAMAADLQGAIRPDFWSTYSVAQLQAFSPRELESCGRLVQPVLLERGQTYYRPISWEEALRRVITRLRGVMAGEAFWYSSGRSSNEAAFLLQLLARLYGTNNVNNCSYYCHQASGVGLMSALGTGTATIELDDLEHADLIFLIGGNPASNHPRLMSTLMNCRRRGGQVIVINPVVETGLVNFRVPSSPTSMLFGSPIASLYVQPHIGGDLALLTGIAKRLVEHAEASAVPAAIDEKFLREHCEDWDTLRAAIEAISWDDITSKSGVSRDQIDDIARRYMSAKHVVFAWTMGITHHAHGVENVQAIVNLAAMRGMLGRPHAGVLPIRGHSNVQGIGSVGVTPKLRDAILDRLQSHFGVTLPTTPGLDTLGCMEAAASGQVKVGICLGGNLFGSNPDAAFAAQAIGRLDLVCYLNTTLNTGHAHGLAAETIILPVLARDEEPQSTTQESMFNYVRLSDGGPSRLEGPRSEVEIVCSLAEGILPPKGPIDWPALRQHRHIRELIAKIVPGFEPLAELDRTKQEFHIGGRVLHAQRFPRAGGRVKLHAHRLPERAGDNSGQLRLMTVRSEGQFNTVVYEDYDLYRGQDRRDVILLHPDDISRLGLTAEGRATVSSSTGRLDNILVRAFPAIRAGNALMYYPEANVLVPRVIDPASRTPAFKNVPITVVPMAASIVAGQLDGGRDAALAGAPANGQVADSPPVAAGHATRDSMRAC
ncbi:MAG: FdhF/YdeP family oxidoreductase [Pirellulales bacterium]|nr:FdhF/YdeP family oxidoreductase [Pirellulales bacterium]